MKVAKPETNPLVQKRTRNFGIGRDIQPARDLSKMAQIHPAFFLQLVFDTNSLFVDTVIVGEKTLFKAEESGTPNATT